MINLENMLSEIISQMQKDKYDMVSFSTSVRPGKLYAMV